MNPEYENLINSLVKDGYLKTPKIIEAFKQIDRVDFVLEEYKADAYINAPLPIGFGQTISQPLTVAFMIELLQPKTSEKILEIGSGSGWQTAMLAYCISNAQTNTDENLGKNAGESQPAQGQGKVVAVERILELKEMAQKNVAKHGFIEKGSVEIVLGDGSKGYKNEAPYDKIIAAAAAEGDVPALWKKQLKIGGRIVAPVGESIIVIDKISKMKYIKKEYFGFSFVPLIKE